jgi:hypothetical protein
MDEDVMNLPGSGKSFAEFQALVLLVLDLWVYLQPIKNGSTFKLWGEQILRPFSRDAQDGDQDSFGRLLSKD